MTAKKTSALHVVEAGETAVETALADPAPPAALMVPAIEPLAEYRAIEHQRRLDAQGEVDLIDARERNAEAAYAACLEAASANCEAEINAAIAKRDRAGELMRQKRDAERMEAARQREQQMRIVTGAEAALAATDAAAEGELQDDAGVRLSHPSDD